MANATTETGAFDESVVFLNHFKDLPDPRQRGKVMYPLDEILLLCLLAVLAGADTFTHRYRPLRAGEARPAPPVSSVPRRHALA